MREITTMPHRFITPLLISGLILASISDADQPAMELFQERIMPIFRSPEPSSCVQCHLASVDLKDYIRPSHEETFLSLRDQGLIDVKSPEKSKILTLIRMGEEDQDPQARRIHATTRRAELEAFSAWIHACCDDHTLVHRPPISADRMAAPEKPHEVIRHARKDRILDSFVRNVWSQRMRCFPCHTPDEFDDDNPAHAKPKQRHREFVQQYGARMNLFKRTPRATMQSMLASSRKRSSRQLPLLNFDDPGNSLLVLKPTSKVPPKGEDGEFLAPSSLIPVSHMGGLKMHVDDVSYKAIVGWIEDVARVRSGAYATAGDLPLDHWHPTDQVLRMQEVPKSWEVGARAQFMIHARDDRRNAWQADPIAFTQGIVTPRRFVGGNLVLLKSGRTESEEILLPPGRYLVKAYLDTDNILRSDPTAMLGPSAFQGELQIEAEWQRGFRNAQLLSGQQLSR